MTAAPQARPVQARPPHAGPPQPPPASNRPARSPAPRPVAAASAHRTRAAGGALLRLVPRLLLLAAVVRTIMLAPVGLQRTDPILGLPPELLDALRIPPGLAAPVEGPVLAVAALFVAVLLRVAGHRMQVWFYTVVTFGTITAAVILM